MTRIITIENHSDRHHVTDIIAAQQQLENLKLARKLNVIDR